MCNILTPKESTLDKEIRTMFSAQVKLCFKHQYKTMGSWKNSRQNAKMPCQAIANFQFLVLKKLWAPTKAYTWKINFRASNLTQPVRVCFKSINYNKIGFQSSNSLQYKKKCCGTIFIPRLTKIQEHLFKLCMKKLLNCKIQTSKASIKNQNSNINGC